MPSRDMRTSQCGLTHAAALSLRRAMCRIRAPHHPRNSRPMSCRLDVSSSTHRRHIGTKITSLNHILGYSVGGVTSRAREMSRPPPYVTVREPSVEEFAATVQRKFARALRPRAPPPCNSLVAVQQPRRRAAAALPPCSSGGTPDSRLSKVQQGTSKVQG